MIEEFDQTRFSAQMDAERKECRKVLITFNDRVTTDRCLRWGRTELADYAGAAAVAMILGEHLTFDLGMQPEFVEAGSEEGPEIPHLPIRIGPEKAKSIAGIEGKVRCRFMPHWQYHYVSSGEKVFRDRVINFDDEESGVFNAINGLKSTIDTATLMSGPTPGGSTVIEPTIDRQQTEERIVDEVTRKLTKGVRIKKEEGDTIAYEDRVLSPDRKNIQIDLRLFYVPVWEVRGKKIVEVNAFTGETLSHPMDDGVELL
jgi:hypothetical protein